MNSNTTKILIIIVLVLVFTLSAFGIYRYLTRNIETPASSGDAAFPESGRVTPIEGEGSVVPPTGSGRAPGVAPVDGGTGAIRQIENGEINIRIASEKPTAGGSFLEKQGAEDLTRKLHLRYVERESGHIYDLGFNENLAKKISNTTITRIHYVYFNNTKTSALIRRLDESNNVQNIYAVLEEPAATTSEDGVIEESVGKLNQTLLSPGIKEIAVSPNKTKVFYLTEVGDNYVGTIEDFAGRAGANRRQVFSSPLSEWLIEWPQENILFFNTKPSVSVPGYLYSQNINGNGLTKVLGGINGLTSSVSPDGGKIIYSESTLDSIRTHIYNRSSRQSSILPISTLPEKCVWGGVEKDTIYCAVPAEPPASQYPDTWYQGVISFDDELWKINTTTNNTELLIDRATFARSGGVDAINLVLSPTEDYLLFNNKKDSSLWQIKLR